jgi:putative Holliday junction resolvase
MKRWISHDRPRASEAPKDATDMRALALDLGSVRIGIAVSDPIGIIARPLKVLQRGSSPADDHRAIAEIVSEEGAELVVVGLPLALDGSVGPAATAALREVESLRDTLRVPVETYDERLTTVSADRILKEQGVAGPDRRKTVDKVAAAVILQSWLDSQNPPGMQ